MIEYLFGVIGLILKCFQLLSSCYNKKDEKKILKLKLKPINQGNNNRNSLNLRSNNMAQIMPPPTKMKNKLVMRNNFVSVENDKSKKELVSPNKVVSPLLMLYHPKNLFSNALIPNLVPNKFNEFHKPQIDRNKDLASKNYYNNFLSPTQIPSKNYYFEEEKKVNNFNWK